MNNTVCYPELVGRCIDKWQSISAPNHVLDWVKHGVPIIVKTLPESFRTSRDISSFTPTQQRFVDSEIERLLTCDAIELCDIQPRCISPIDVVPKKEGHRLIIKLRHLNSHCEPPSFTQEDIRTVKYLVQSGDHIATIDIKDGFLHIPVYIEHRTLLGFEWRHSYYQWYSLPFGICVSPYYFTKVIRPIIAFLRIRSQGIRLSVFVDDFIVLAQPQLFTDHVDQVIHTLQDLGWIINLSKTDISPHTRKTYLGHRIDSCGQEGYPEISITPERIRKLKRSLNRALRSDRITARNNLARIT